MKSKDRSIVIIGGGIAGLCAAVYARKCGYRVEVLEKNGEPGGLATSWKRGDYTFETCLHWLLGSNPEGALHACWREVFDIDSLKFVYPREFITIEDAAGRRLAISASPELLEKELLWIAPQDAAAIEAFIADLRRLNRFEMPTPGASMRNWGALLEDLPCFPMMLRLLRVNGEEYARRFNDPLIRAFFSGGAMSRMSSLALFLSLAWQNQHNAGYPVGGSRAVIESIAENLQRLGGVLRRNTEVERILVKENQAIGVQLAGGTVIPADWVISAADRHTTIHGFLNGAYKDTSRLTVEPFPSYLQASFGIARDLSEYPGFLVRLLDAPLRVDPQTEHRSISFRFFHFDPTFAPRGKTAVTCFLPTYNFDYWLEMQRTEPDRYQKEKQRVAYEVAEILERIAPETKQAIEVSDVSTPATVINYTGNWRGSMEGWLLTPAVGLRGLTNRLPGLRRFFMAGHWVMPGGGLPSGLITARNAIRLICKEDRVEFAPYREGTERAARDASV